MVKEIGLDLLVLDDVWSELLPPDAVYAERGTDKCYSGSLLMNVGIGLSYRNDHETAIVVFDKVK